MTILLGIIGGALIGWGLSKHDYFIAAFGGIIFAVGILTIFL